MRIQGLFLEELREDTDRPGLPEGIRAFRSVELVGPLTEDGVSAELDRLAAKPSPVDRHYRIVRDETILTIPRNQTFREAAVAAGLRIDPTYPFVDEVSPSDGEQQRELSTPAFRHQ